MTAEAPIVQPDYSPLTAPLSKQEIDEFRRQSKAQGAPWAHRPDPTGQGTGGLIARLVPVVVPVLGVLFLLFVVGPDLPSLVRGLVEYTLGAPFPMNLFFVGFAAIWLLAIGAAAFALVRWIAGAGYPRRWWEIALRLTRFASANGLVYGHEEPISYPGSVFQVGERRTAERRLGSASGRRTEIGTYRYIVRTRNRKGQDRITIHRWGYIAIDLDRNLPHMLLDARANDRSLFGIRASNLPVQFDRDQVLSLEGDFNEHFTLYAPQEYERDALYVFTPDLMALLIDEVGGFDVEIVDDTMFVYSPTPFDLLSPATYERMRGIVATVGAKALRQTARYADERVGDRMRNVVAEPGRRLKRRTNWIAIIGVGLIVAWWVYNTFLVPMFGLPPFLSE